jgi:hypothetical protein
VADSFRHPGLRLSLIGGIVFLFGAATLLVLPEVVAAALMLVGGMGVWSGFIWTLFSWYLPSSKPPPEA